MTITCLMDDYCPQKAFGGEHGLSLLIETPKAKILFDTGQSGTFLKNAEHSGIDLKDLDAVVLSHGHYDHSGGLQALYASLSPSRPRFFAGPGFDAPRHTRTTRGTRDVGIVSSAIEGVPKPEIIFQALEIASGIRVLPPAPLDESAPSLFKFRKSVDGREQPDTFEDELSLVLEAENGITVVTGCAHRGIANIVRAARKAFPGKPLRAIAGGFHLVEAPDETMKAIASELAGQNPGYVFCSHCTGLPGYAALRKEMPDKVEWLACGMRIEV